MIYVNKELINVTSFPDGTTSFKFLPNAPGEYYIEWLYDGDHECMLLWHLVHHIRANTETGTKISLYMPYIPNARMDRVKNKDEVFTLKWFADFINALNLTRVMACDPHSNVSAALINRFFPIDAEATIKKCIDDLRIRYGKKDLLLCYPDEGASKRYSSQIANDYVFCVKHREWSSGKILGLELIGADKVVGKSVLIVDDICSRGGTFTHTAKALKDAGAKDIFLYVTHCENTIRDGLVLIDGLIDHVFTTNSIFRGEHDKITVL